MGCATFRTSLNPLELRLHDTRKRAKRATRGATHILLRETQKIKAGLTCMGGHCSGHPEPGRRST